MNGDDVMVSFDGYKRSGRSVGWVVRISRLGSTKYGMQRRTRCSQCLMSAETFVRPAIILVRPQLDRNVGAVARAMLNFGFTDLRMVDPICWNVGENPTESALAISSGAEKVLHNSQSFTSIHQAVADLNITWATTARVRTSLNKHCDTPRTAAKEMIHRAKYCEINASSNPAKIGILFGCEASGLSNDELVSSTRLLTIPTHHEFSSLNLAQAVLLVCHEWFTESLTNSEMANATTNAVDSDSSDLQLAAHGDIAFFLDRTFRLLQERKFFRVKEHMASTSRKIESLAYRCGLHKSELNILNGIITNFSKDK